MRTCRRAFALIIVLIALAGVFALTLRAAVISRSGFVESTAVRDQLLFERIAGAAAVLALDAYLPVSDTLIADSGGTPGARPTSAPQEPEKRIELPPFLVQMIPELAEVQQRAREEVPFDRGDNDAFPTASEATAQRINAIERLRSVGLPAEPLVLTIGGYDILVDYEDLSGLLDLNVAGEDSILALLVNLDVSRDIAPRIAAQILDWRDPDSMRRYGGAERDDYRPFGVVPRDGPIIAAEELLYLPDMTPEIYNLITPYIAFSSGTTDRLSIAAAPRPVLLAIPGVTPDIAETIIDARTKEPLTESQLNSLLPPRARDGSMQLTHTISGQLRARVRILDPASGRVQSSFTAIVSLSDRRARLVAIRPESS